VVGLAILVLVPVAVGLATFWFLLGWRLEGEQRVRTWLRFAVFFGPSAALLILVVEVSR
jgi:hypothetical protein